MCVNMCQKKMKSFSEKEKRKRNYLFVAGVGLLWVPFLSGFALPHDA